MTCGGQEFQPPARLLDVLSWGDSRGQDDSEMAMIRLCLDKTLSYHGDCPGQHSRGPRSASASTEGVCTLTGLFGALGA